MEMEIRDIPDHLKIKASDLPKMSKHLEENQQGVANIIASLGPELYDDFDEAEEKSFQELQAVSTEAPVAILTDE
jgi:5'-deoxynucleotidase YfbR-like HD superfamily hydrolase